MLDKLVKQTIHISLFVQVITTVLSLDGFTLKLSENDQILKEILGIENIYTEKGIVYVDHLENALKAKAVYKKEKDYVVKDRQVVIVDESTGRLQPGRS